MAMSNWEMATWDKNGIPCENPMEMGLFTVEVYKNWINVKGRYFNSLRQKIYIQIEEDANIILTGVTIKTSTGEQNSIFVFAEEWGMGTKEHKKFFGIGAYRYDESGDPIGIQEETFAEFNRWLVRLGEKPIKDKTQINQGDAFFASAFGEPVTSVSTKIGEAKETMLMTALKGESNEVGRQ